ncbi:MAG: hypothetical protein ABI609_01725 [Acidobacteriota bacterium]
MNTDYSAGERFALWLLAAAGLVGLNGAFIYGLMASPGSLRAALTNPVAVAFILEALVLVVVLAYLLGKWGLLRIGWVWFVLLSLIGGLAFALPVALLWRRQRGGNR